MPVAVDSPGTGGGEVDEREGTRGGEVGRRIARGFDLFVEGSNLLDEEYQEIAGVRMPGATVAIGLALRAR